MALYLWTGNGDGDSWADPNNWSVAGVLAQTAPGSSDSITFDTAATITDQGSAAFATIIAVADIDSGNLTTTSGLTVDGGALSVEAGGVVTVASQGAGSPSLTVEDGGSIDLSGGSRLQADGPGPAIIGTTGDGNASGGTASGGTLTIEDGAGASFETAASDQPALIVGDGDTGSVTVEGSDSLLTSAGGPVTLGTSGGAGTLEIDAGASANLTSTAGLALDIGSDTGSTGTVIVSGSGSVLSTDQEIDVGDGGTGQLTLEGGGSISTTDQSGVLIDLGVETSGIGTMVLTGQATAVTLSGGDGVIVGDAGVGEIDVDKGASFDVESGNPSTAIELGSGLGSGTLSVDGIESTVTVGAGGLQVGGRGSGTVTVSAGGTLDVTDTTEGLQVGTSAGSMGQIDVTGAGSVLNASGPVDIGVAGTGNLTIEASGTFVSGTAGQAVDIGVLAGGTGTLTVSGLNTSVTLASGTGVLVGDGGTGTLAVAAGANLAIDSAEPDAGYAVALAGGTASTGVLTVDGDGSILTVGAGGLLVGSQGSGFVTVSGGAALDVTDATQGMDIAATMASSGDVAITGTGSTLVADGPVVIGDQGTGSLEIEDGGTLQMTGSATIDIGAQRLGSGTLELSGSNAALDYSGALSVGDAGTGTLELERAAAWASSGDIVAGSQAGSSGTVEVSGAGTLLTVGQDLTIGAAGLGALDIDTAGGVTVDGNLDEATGLDSQSTTTLSGIGTLLTVDGDWIAGTSGTATDLIEAGATAAVGGDLMLGQSGTGNGQLTLSGDGTSLDFAGTVTVGAAGTGSLLVSGGAVMAPAGGETGALDIAAQSGSTGTVTVDGSGSQLETGTLSVGGTATGAGGSGLLTVSGEGLVSVTQASVWSTGTVSMAGGTLATGALTIAAGGAITGNGVLGGTITNNGTITVSGGTLDVENGVDGTGTLAFGAGAILALDDLASVNAGVQQQDFNALLTGFATGDTIKLATDGLGLDSTVDGYQMTADGSDTQLILTDGATTVATLQLAGNYLDDNFVLAPDAKDAGQIDLTLACYAQGTRIRTERGEVAVQYLTLSDRVVTASGAMRPIRWIGHRGLDLTRHARLETARPVRVLAGAFGEALPVRDLWLSPCHAVFVAGVLIPIGSLVNGTTISPVEQASITYWHVELDSHDILLAEGLPAESYLDCGNRAAFSNGGGVVQLHPAFEPHDGRDACAPLLRFGPQVMAVKAQLDDRAEQMQRSQPRAPRQRMR